MASPSPLPYYLDFQEKHEVREPTEAAVTGELPPWLQGRLVRNGAAVFRAGETRLRHLFDGLACLHQFLLDGGGRVRYQSRVLDSDTWRQCQQAGCLLDTQFGTAGLPDPCKNIFSRYFSYFRAGSTDNTCVHVIPHGDRLLAMTETAKVRLVDPNSLSSAELGKVDLASVLEVRLATAHPHLDSRDGGLYNLATHFNPRQAYSIVRVPPPSEVEEGVEPLERARVVGRLASRWKGDISYNHSFGTSDNYFVLLEQPLTYNTLKLIFSRFTGSSVEECMVDHQGQPTLLHVVSREDGKEVATRYVTSGFFCFHFVNCYEVEEAGGGSFLLVDLVAYQTSAVVHGLYLQQLQDLSLLQQDPPRYTRFVLPLHPEQAETGCNLVGGLDPQAQAVRQQDGSVLLTPHVMFDGEDGVSLELPRINESKLRSRHRFVYGTSFISQDSALCKADVETGKTLQWREENFFAGEPVFVPDPEGTEEDDGVVLSTLMSRHEDSRGCLLVLDARTFTELARASIPQPQGQQQGQQQEQPQGEAKLPLSFHGSWMPAARH